MGGTIPEYEMRGFDAVQQGYYIECPTCVGSNHDEQDIAEVRSAREKIEKDYEAFLVATEEELEEEGGEEMETPLTITEVGTPVDVELEVPKTKLRKMAWA